MERGNPSLFNTVIVEENMVQRLAEFDRMRGIAILAVIIIHVTADATISYSSGSPKFIIYNIINSLVQFAVPLFLFISSIVLSYKFSQERIYLKQFYVKRIKSAVIPYILWSVFYIFSVKIFYGYGNLLSWRNWIKWLITGTAFYHLYFLLIIVQLYLAIPLLFFIFRRVSFSVMLFTVIVAQSLFYYANKIFIYPYYPYPACLLGSYIPVCFVGTWIGARYQQVLNLWMSHKSIINFLSALFVVIFLFVNIAVRMAKPIDWRVYYGIYHIFALMVSISVWLAMTQKSFTFLDELGNQSFAIYLIHPLFLAIGNLAWKKLGFFTQELHIGLNFIIICFLSYLFGKIVSQQRVLSKVFLSR